MSAAEYSLDKIESLSKLTSQEGIDRFYGDSLQIGHYTVEKAIAELHIYQEQSAYLRARYKASRALGESVVASTLLAVWPPRYS